MFIKKQDTELQTQRKLQKAGAALGFSRNQAVTAEMVRARFVELVKASHPDGNMENIEPWTAPIRPVELTEIRKAKDLLLKHMEDDDA